ncbi:MAG: ribosome biogenesis GTPase Der [Stenotrophobium sp.]
MNDKLPILALVGRPNVGKSTLFNRLTGTRDALVADLPGLTRDRQYGYARFEDRNFMVVDTGGLMPEATDALAVLAEEQAQIALEEADHVLFLVDAEKGRMGADESIARHLRTLKKPVTLVVNKAEGQDRSTVAADFFPLGYGEACAISATHGDGITALLRQTVAKFPETSASASIDDGGICVTIIGRPNVGKSTLINRLLGEERVLAANQPGTTRDSIAVPFEYGGRPYTLIDTAGIRRRSRVSEAIEKFSIVKTLEAIERAHVVIAVVDAQNDIGEQDARLMGLVAQRGRAMILAVNKWDGLDHADREKVRYQTTLKLPFLDYAPVHFISAKQGSGLGELMRDVQACYLATMREIPTPELTRSLEKAVEAHPPPAIMQRRIKLRYAHQGGNNPPVIVIHGNQTDKLPVHYKRYLANHFRDAFKLKGVPLALLFKTGDNPFKDKKNVLTPRQIKKKKRTVERFRK